MKISDLLQMCVRNLVRRKFRTILTIMGVVFGTTSIIMMISLGIGVSVQNEEQLKMWSDLTMISVNQMSDETPLNDEAVEQMQQIDGVVAASPMEYLDFSTSTHSAEIGLFAGKRDVYRARWPEVYFLYPEALLELGYKIEKGETLPAQSGKTVKAVIGGQMAYRFEDTRKRVNNRRSPWPDENGVVEDPFFDPLETELKLVITPQDEPNATPYEVPVEVVGVLVAEQNRSESMYGMFLSIEDVNAVRADYEKVNGIKRSKDDQATFSQASVKAADIDSVAGIQEIINGMGFYTWSMDEERVRMQESLFQMQLILGSIGGITLLVSAFSIANTMVMSVYERTREIGVIKVLGCLVSNIRSMFLLEAGFIGFFGGIAGIALSYSLSFLLNYFGGAMAGDGGGIMGMFGMYGGMGETMQISIIPLWLVALGLAFATGIGLVAGFYPAYRAVRISALEAIKQE